MNNKILYNITIKIDPSSHEDWLKWMKDVHIPDVMKTELFESYKMSQILGTNESEGFTYAIQYVSPGLNDFEKYTTEFAPGLQQEHAERYKDKYVAFRTMMRIVQES